MRILVTAVALTLASPLVMAESQLNLELTGNVAPVCDISRQENINVDLTSETTRSMFFDIYCNTEMTISLQSANGGLHNTSRDTGNDGEPVVYSYTAFVSLSDFDFQESYRSDKLKEGVVAEVNGGVIFSDSMEVKIELDNELEEGYAGLYTDSISVSIFPSLAVSLN